MYTLDQLEAERAALPDVAELQRQLSEHTMTLDSLTVRIQTIRSADATIAEVDPEIATFTKDHDALNKVRDKLCQELLAQPSRPRTGHDLGVLQNLKLSIYAIDHGLAPLENTGYCLSTLRLGALLREAGIEWQGSLSELEREIKQLTKRRNDVQRRREDALRTDDERQARLEAAKKIPQRKTRGDGSQYDKYADGRIVEVPATDAPPAQGEG